MSLPFSRSELIYENPLTNNGDIADFVMEGDAVLSFLNGRLRMENTLDPALGQKSNFVFWCEQELPDNVCVSWEFWPIREPGLAMLFFSARAENGKSIFDPALKPRAGIYDQYHDGDINALHVSYFRRKHPRERAFCTCNLRKSRGFHLVAQGADPIPNVADAEPPYTLTLWKVGPRVIFSVAQADEEIHAIDWTDDGVSYGPVLTGGYFGFRQMAPLIGEYTNLRVWKVG
ncbi:YesU family protein [soil metagenome]